MSELVAIKKRLTVIYRSMIMIPFLSHSLMTIKSCTKCRTLSEINISNCFRPNVRTYFLHQGWAYIESKRDLCHLRLIKLLFIKASPTICNIFKSGLMMEEIREVVQDFKSQIKTWTTNWECLTLLLMIFESRIKSKYLLLKFSKASQIMTNK